jgi:molybdopterin-guanine dinucleotide biosynthesis protein A
MKPLTTIVLAGGPLDAVAALQPGAPNKAFVRVAGRSLVERTIAGLRAAPSVGRIVAVAPQSAHRDPAISGADACVPDGVRISDSLRSGLLDLPNDELVLISASDMPVLTGVAVEDFVARARDCDPEIGYGCVERGVHLARYPEVPHTWARMRDGTFCGGGLMVMRPRAFPLLERFIERLGAARKNPLRLASLFGWDVLLRYAAHRLSIAQAEARASEILGACARAIVSPYPETAVNVDRPSDVALAERLISGASSSA